ncbi:ESPR-type extended signal peptide-containing protein [Oligella urethralis]|uniref:Haemagglutinin n=1 Tax=Oligella urethralis TaxID=90245 RepID=A0A2X1UMW8_9BURK|nr:ESPR-type extended signal peptide-containing protein [Oligella urethralis]SPY08437.1 Haemagglutinin [Oligella urethralis]
MNKIYRSVYNDSLGAWVAVSELDGHQGKRTGGVVKNTLNRAIRGFKLSQIALALGLGLGLSSTAAWAKDAEFSFSDPTIACRPVSSPSDTSFVGGGENNTACNDYAFVGGGRNNTASGKYNFVGGGQNNLAGFPDGNWSFNGEYSSVVGGENNLASGKYTFVGGGENNTASGNYNFIGGGQNNAAHGNTISSPYNNFSSIVGGQKNTTYGDYTFIGGGQNNTASGNYNFIGGGQNNTTSGKYSFIGGGQNNTTSGNYSFVGGGFNSQALGLGSFSGGGFSTYYGYEYAQINGATAYGDNSFAFGAGAVANANDTIAIGRDTVAATTRQSNYEAAVAIGKNAKATAQNGIALGFDISNSGKNTFAIGSNITSTANNAVVLGVGSEGVDDAVSVGSQTSARKIVYVADGKLSEDSTDAVNGSQLHATNTRVDVLDTQVSTNTQSINQLTTDVANNTTNITNLSDTVGKGWSIASKGNAEAQKVAMGDTVEFTNKDGNIAVKHDGLSVSFDLAEELKLTSLTVGDKVTITNTGINAGDTVITNVANGNVAENSKDAVNGGQLFETNTRIDELSGSMSTLDGLAVKYDSDAKDKVTLGNPEKAVTLTNVAAGKLSEDSTDAVNGSQLHATNTRVDALDTQVSTNTQSINQLTTDVANNTTNITNLSDTVGKGWSIASKGNAEAQKVAMGDTVEFTNKDGNIAVKHDGLSVSFDLAEELKLTSLTVGDKVTITNTGINAGDTVITNVANGNVAENSKDAVNGGQLFETNTRIDELSGSMSTLDGLAVKYDSDAKDKVTLGNPEKAVTLTNVAAGKLSEDSTDAVNGGQVFDVKTELSGEIAQVGDKVTQVEGNVTQLTNRITINEADIVNLKAADALAVKYDGTAKDTITLSGAEGTLLTNLKGGEIAKDSTDAVTGGQLFDVKNHLENNVSTVANQLSEGIRFGDGKTDNQYALGKTISVLGDDNITSKTVPGGVQLGLANVIKIGSHDIPLSIDGESGVITGLTNTTWPSTGEVVADRAATEGQLQAVYELAATAGGKVKVEGGKNILVSSHQNDENTTVYQVATTADLTANSITFNGTGDSTTTIKLGDNGLDVGGTTITNLKGGEIAKGSTDAVTGGQVFDVKTELSGEIAQVGDKVTQVAGNVTQLTNRITVNEADIVNLKAADALAVKYDGTAKDTITLSGAEGTLLTNLKGGEIAKGSTDAVTGGQMFDMQERFKQNLLDVSGISQGLDFAADSGKFNRKLGETIRVVGSNNITTQANNGTITVSMADNPVFKGQVQAQGGLVVQDHLAVAPGSIIDAGGNPISNIGPGTKPGDAVNVQQLAEVQQQLGGQIGQIHSELDRATKDARGGTAAAMAMANLPQAWRPGQSGVAMSGSTYKGQKGYAIGVSHMSENGKWVFKGSVGGSNRGSTGVAVGAFYSFN